MLYLGTLWNNKATLIFQVMLPVVVTYGEE
jgi:hypothetical protein